jgi:hypothetical protein
MHYRVQSREGSFSVTGTYASNPLPYKCSFLEVFVARPVKWINRLHEIRQRVLNSKIETWDRQAIEDLFDVRRVTAQSIMRAVGELSNVAGAHLASRSSLLEFVDDVLAADDMELAVRTRIDTAAAAPSQKRGLRLPIPDELRAVRLADLSKHIKIAPGLLTIEGADAFEILTQLAVLARAIDNDLDSFVMAWNRPPVPSGESPADMDLIWAELEAMESSRRAMD